MFMARLKWVTFSQNLSETAKFFQKSNATLNKL